MIELDLELIQKVRSGNKEAFTQFVRVYTPYVYRTAFAYLHDTGEAEDVTQDVFIKVYRSISELNEVQAFPAWFKRIISNTSLDRLRKRSPTPVPDEELAQNTFDSGNSMEQGLAVREALKRLNPEYREVLILREWQGYDYQEIAELLTIPLGTVKSRIHSARMQLRKLLDPG